MSDTLRILVSRALAPVSLCSAIFQPDDCHWLPVKFRYGSDVNHVDSGKLDTCLGGPPREVRTLLRKAGVEAWCINAFMAI